jgi:tripartite-type tricarboxylate transporter receptor subunit TctC
VKVFRRTLLQLAAGALLAPATTSRAPAQSYPTRPVRIVVGNAPGGATDIFARLIGQWLSDRFGQPFIIENRPGAGSNIAVENVVRSQPDGHTLFLCASANAVNVTLYEKLTFDFIRDTTAVAIITREPLVISVHPSLPVKTIAEFIDYGKTNRGKLSFASTGNGTMPHIGGELFKMMTSIDMVHVPYRGGAPAMTDLIGGQVQAAFLGPTVSIEHIKAGKIRALAVTSEARAAALPDVPTVGESLAGYEVSQWFGLVAPRGTPIDVIEKLNTEVNAALNDPKVRGRLIDLGGTVIAGSPGDFGKRIADDAERWAKVIRAAKIKAD